MTKVLVLGGGSSPEREVSLRSAAAVASALRQAGYTVTSHDPADGDEAALLQAAAAADVVFPALHGAGGEDGSLQLLFERHGIPCVGSGPTASALCYDKWQYKQAVHAIADTGITLPRGELVRRDSLQNSQLIRAPYVLKPATGGSSIDTFIVRDPATAQLGDYDEAFTAHGGMLLEELIEGREITVGVLGDQALPVVAIMPPDGAEFDYANKYNGQTRETCPPADMAGHVQAAAREAALRLHRALGLSGLSRTDMIVTDDNRLVVLETNTIPGLTEQSLFPLAARTAGYPMPRLADTLVTAALARPSAG